MADATVQAPSLALAASQRSPTTETISYTVALAGLTLSVQKGLPKEGVGKVASHFILVKGLNLGLASWNNSSPKNDLNNSPSGPNIEILV